MLGVFFESAHLRRGRGLGEPGSILLDENVTCRRGESSAKADGSKANTAIRVMLATMERIIRCFAVFARYLPEVLLCSLFLFAPVVVSSATLYTIPHTPTPATLDSAGSSNIRCDEHGASFLLSASLRHQSKATQASKHRPAAASASGGVIPVTSRLLSLSLALGKEASNSQSASLDKTTASPHNNRQTNIPPTYALRTAPATPPRSPPPPPPRSPARTQNTVA